MAGNSRITIEKINEVILRLLNLKSGVELDYQTYFNVIKKRLAISRIKGSDLLEEEDILLRNELKRIWSIDKSERFKIKIKKVKISIPSKNGITNKADIIEKKPEIFNIINLLKKFELEKYKNIDSNINTLINAKTLETKNKKQFPIIHTILNVVKKIIEIRRPLINDPRRVLDRPETTLKPKTSAIVKFDPRRVLDRPDLSVRKVNVRDITETQPKKDKPKDSIYDILVRISKVLDSILKTITETNKQETKKTEKERIANEEKSRKLKENKLESGGFKEIMGAVKKLMAPFQSIWDRIINFFVNVFLGKVVLKLLNWFGDPKNADKIKSMIRFVKDWWPALLAGYILFGTSFGKGIRSITGIVVKSLFRLTKAIPQILKFIAKNKVAAGAIGLFTAGAWIPQMFPGTVNEQERKTDKAPGTKEDKISKLQEQKSNLNFFEKLQGKGSEIDEQISYLQTGKTKSYGFAGGGYANKMPRSSGFAGGGYASRLKSKFASSSKGNIKKDTVFSGKVSGKKGVDKVPAMLTDGEFVMSVGAVNKYGVENLEAMNAAGGGTNKPKVINGITKAVGGGRIGNRDDGDYPPSGKIDPVGNIKKWIKQFTGTDIDKPETWGKPQPPRNKDENNGGIAGIIQRRAGYEYNKIFGGNRPPSNQLSSYSNQPPQSTRTPEAPRQTGGGIAGTIQRRAGYEYNKIFGSNRPPSNQPSPSPRTPEAPRRTGGGVVGTIQRRMGYEYNKRFGDNKPSSTPKPTTTIKPSGAGTSEGYGADKSNVFGGLQRSSYRDAGKVYLRSLMGGVGGDLTEKDFSPENQKLLEQAVKRAESRQAQKIKKAQAELTKDPNSPTKKSDLKRLLAGQIRLEYGDYASKIQIDPKTGKYKPIYTEAEDDLKNILGQSWFKKQKTGGYRSTNEKYDFQKYQAPLAMLAGITAFENEDVKKSGVNFQKRLEAIHQIASDPASIYGKQFADMVKPYKDTPIGKMLGIGGIAKDLEADVMIGGKRPEDNPKNTKTLEAKRPWWDKMGVFGGATAQKERESEQLRSTGMAGRYVPGSSQVNIGKSRSQEFLRRNPGTILYNKPKPNTATPYRSRFARPKNAGVKPPTPPGRGGGPRVSTVNAGRRGKPSATSRPANGSRPPAFSPTHRRSRGKTLSMSVYGVMM